MVEIFTHLIFPFIFMSAFVFAVILLLLVIFRYAVLLVNQRKRENGSLNIPIDAVKVVYDNKLFIGITYVKIYKLALVITIGIYLVVIFSVVIARL